MDSTKFSLSLQLERSLKKCILVYIYPKHIWEVQCGYIIPIEVHIWSYYPDRIQIYLYLGVIMKWYQDLKFFISLIPKHSYNCKLRQAWQYTWYVCSECSPNKRYMVDIRNINFYLKITINLGQFHQENQDMTMIWYNDIGYLLIPKMTYQWLNWLE